MKNLFVVFLYWIGSCLLIGYAILLYCFDCYLCCWDELASLDDYLSSNLIGLCNKYYSSNLAYYLCTLIDSLLLVLSGLSSTQNLTVAATRQFENQNGRLVTPDDRQRVGKEKKGTRMHNGFFFFTEMSIKDTKFAWVID